MKEFNIGEKVKVVKSKTIDGEGLIGATGRITGVDKSKEYDYIVDLTMEQRITFGKKN